MSAPARWCIVAAAAFMLCLALHPVAAAAGQHAAHADEAEDLRTRNRAFLNAAEAFDVDSMLSFFPQTGEFTYTFTLHHPTGDSIGIWRFPAADARRAIEGPLRVSLDQQGHEIGVGTFASALASTFDTWKLVRGSRFVPPKAGASSAVFVQWRRERSRWVVAAFGDEGFSDETMGPSWMQ